MFYTIKNCRLWGNLLAYFHYSRDPIELQRIMAKFQNVELAIYLNGNEKRICNLECRAYFRNCCSLKVADVTTGKTVSGFGSDLGDDVRLVAALRLQLCPSSERQVTMQGPRFGCGPSSKELTKTSTSELWEKVSSSYILVCLSKSMQLRQRVS